MVAEIIQNPLTRQGTSRDVESRFSIKDVIRPKYAPKQLRALTSVESLPYKVVGYVPQVMGDVSFSVGIAGGDTEDYAEDDLIWVTNQLKRFMPWMVQAQILANTVGKAYVIFEAERLAYDVPNDTFVNQDIPISPVNIDLTEIGNQPDPASFIDPSPGADPTRQVVGRGSIDRPLDSPFFRQVNNITISPEQLVNYYPMLAAINWREEEVQRLTPFNVVAGDRYVWSSDRKYLYRKDGTFQTAHSGFNTNTDSYGISRISVSQDDVLQWAETQVNGSIAGGGIYQTIADRVKATQYEVVDASHVIEITAFDYQDNTDLGGYEDEGFCVMDPEDVGETGKKRVSYRLVRFTTAFLRYISFVNATLNRMHRSEFIAYGKEGLGDINLDIARALARVNTNGAGPDGGLPLDPVEVIQAELDRILESAMNMGIVMYDAKHKIDMLARSMTGIDKLHDVFAADVIGASGLTEFTLFGKNDAGAGLASLDIRDRKFIADQADSLWADHWEPALLFIAKQLAFSTDSISDIEVVTITPEKSFKLTDLEAADFVDKMIASRMALIEKSVFSPKEIRREILANGLLGQYFNINVVEGETPDDLVQETPTVATTPGSQPPIQVRQGDALSVAQLRNRQDGLATFRIWQSEINMTLIDMERWRLDPRSQFGTKSESIINRVVRLLSKSSSAYSRRDINLMKTEIATLRRMKARWLAGQQGQPLPGAGVSRMFIALLNHGFNPLIQS